MDICVWETLSWQYELKHLHSFSFNCLSLKQSLQRKWNRWCFLSVPVDYRQQCHNTTASQWRISFLHQGGETGPGSRTWTTVKEGSNTATFASTQETLGCLQDVFDEGMRCISGFGHQWRLFLIPEFLITGRHSTDKCNADNGKRYLSFPLSQVFS